MDEENKRDVSGHGVYFNEEAADGVNYLDQRIDYGESEVFFRSAKTKGKVDFEDQEGRDFTLRYDGGKYLVEKRQKKSGWWPF